MSNNETKVNFTTTREKSDIEKKNISEDGRIIMKLMHTGGFDSTYRLLELSFEPVIIQPYYVFNENRKSAEIEITTAKKIHEMIRKRETTKAEIKEIIVLKLEDYLPVSDDIITAYNNFRKKEVLGGQNPWINQIAKTIDGLQITEEGIKNEKPDSNELDTLHRRNRIKYYEDNPALCISQITPKGPDDDFYYIINNYYLPENILHLCKEDMLENYKKWDAMDIAETTWFCHYPVNNEPCGWCLPCLVAVDETGIWRLKGNSLRRYKLRHFYRAGFKIKKFFDLSSKKIKAFFKKDKE